MTEPSAGSRLHGCLRAFPAAALELSADGVVRDSNGRLESVVGAPVIGRAFADLLDETSARRWERLLGTRTEGGSPSSIWELILVGRDTLELRTFAAVWGRERNEDVLWLVEYSRDLKLEPMYEELAAANAELVQTQRDLARERARLSRVLAGEEAARAAAERASARLQALHAITASGHLAATPRESAAHLLSGLRQALPVDSAAVLLLEEPVGPLRVLAATGLEAAVDEPTAVPLDGSFAGRVLRERRSLLVRTPSDSDVSSPYLRRAMQVVAGAPMIVGDQLIGVLRVGSTAPDAFSPDDLQLLELVARDMAAAVERARLLEAERAARSEAERAVRLRDEVLAIVAHDLRNPLSRIRTTVSFLSMENVAPPVRENLMGVLDRATATMDRLIRDLLDVATIESGRLSVELQPLDAARLLVDVCQWSAPAAAQHRLQLQSDAEPPLPVLADPERISQVFANLIDNAIRVTPPGGQLSLAGRRAGDRIVLSLADTGPGIPEAELPHLFDRFWQGDREKRGAAGLGLAIAKGIIDAHGGDIRVESTLGRGTTFHIELPSAD